MNQTMNQSWRDKMNQIINLIKKISNAYGGDNQDWLKEYCKDVIKAYSHNLDEAIKCFENVLKNIQ